MNESKAIIIPLEGNFAHSADFLRQTAFTLAAQNNQVYIYDQDSSHFWLKNPPAINHSKYKNISFHVVRYFLPFRRIKAIDNINKKLSFWIFLKTIKNKNKILWIFYPRYHYLVDIIDKKTISLYDCVDYHYKKRIEETLIRKINYFFVNSKSLYNLHKSKEPILIESQGFFIPKRNMVQKPTIKYKKPIIGFIGGINHRLDFVLLHELIKNNQQWQFVFCGPIQWDKIKDSRFKTKFWIEKIKKLKNTSFFSNMDREHLYEFIKLFDVAIIPYNTKIIFNRYCYPMKVFEYLYFGKHVISTDIIELNKTTFSKFVSIAKNDKEFAHHIEQQLKEQKTKKEKETMRNMAISNSWENKIKQIIKIVEREDPNAF